MKNFDLEKRRYVLSAIASLIIVVYIIRLFSLQIASDDYRKSADSNAFLKKIEFPSRGTITDRNGKLLVYNQPAYDIMVVMNEEAGRLDTMDFCNALGITKEFFKKRMAEIKDRSKNPGYSRFTQQLFMGQLPDKEFSAFQEKIFRFPGFYIQRRSIRQYKEPLAAHLLGDQQNLHEQRRQLWQKSLAKGGYRVVIRMVVGGDVPEGHRVVGRLLQLAAGKNAGRVAVKQQGQQHLGMMGLGAAPGVGGLDRGQVELADYLDDESRQMPLGQPVVHRRRHQVQGFPINLTKGVTHGFITFAEIFKTRRVYHLADKKSDRLLGV